MLADSSESDDNLPEIFQEYTEMLKSTFSVESTCYSDCNIHELKVFLNICQSE